MITHSVTVQGRVIGYPHNERVISRNVQVDAIAATFDAEWAAATSVLAVFTNGKAVVRVDAGYKSGKATVTVPWEVLADDGILYVSFVGYLPGNARIVTERMKRPFLVERGGEVDGGAAASPSPDVIQTAMADAAAATAKATAAAASANSAAQSANANSAAANSAADAASKAAQQASAAAGNAKPYYFQAAEPPRAKRVDGMLWLHCNESAKTAVAKRWDANLPGKAVFPGASTMPGTSTVIDEIGAWTAFTL